MKLPITWGNEGMMLMEIMLACALTSVFFLSIFSLSFSVQKMHETSLRILKSLVVDVDAVKELLNNNLDTDFATTSYGNKGVIYSRNLFSLLRMGDMRGRSTCSYDIQMGTPEYIQSGFDIGALNMSTDIEVRNGLVFLSADSSIASSPDFFVIATQGTSTLLSSLHTGPGVPALEVAGPYAYLAQASTQRQLQILDVHDISHPYVLSQWKTPLPTATTTAPFATSIFYDSDFIYLGTEKWNGAEFMIIDVHNPQAPHLVGSFETNTLINDIYVEGDMAYLATSDMKQMRILDISDKTHPLLISEFSPSGWQTQEGKDIDIFESKVGLGRTVGGFNVLLNHEAYIFATSSSSHDIPGGVYSLLITPSYVILLTHASGEEVQVWNHSLTEKIHTYSLNVYPRHMICDEYSLYFATGNSNGFSTLHLHQP